MSTTRTWPGGSIGATAASYSIPAAGEVNWPNLSNFLIALANGAQCTTFQKFAIRKAIATPVTVAITDCIVVSDLTVAGAVAQNLPQGANKQIFYIVDGKGDAATNNITITPFGSETIAGAATLVLSGNREGVMLAFDSSDTDWKIINRFNVSGTNIGGFTASSAIVSTAGGFLIASATTAAQIGYLSVITGVTGTGKVVLDTSPTIVTPTLNTPTLVTPILGVATATSINGLTITATTGTLTLVNGSTLATAGAFSTTLTSTAATNVTLPTTGTLATLAGAEALTNKTVNGLTITTTTGTLTLVNGSTLATAGAFSTTLTATGATNITLPTTGTLATLAGAEALTNKTVNGLTITATTGTLTLVNGSTLVTAGAFSITLTSTAATNITLPTTGTLATLAGAEALTNKTVNGLTITATTGTLTLVNGSTLVTAGAFSTTLTSTAATNVTLPTTGTLATLAGAEILTNKDLDGGVATNARRITVPGDTIANLTALTRKAGTVLYGTDTTTLYYDNGAALVTLAASGGTLAIANGGTGQTTAAAAFNALAPTTTQGDIIYRNATTNTRLGAGTAGNVLKTGGAGADPAWGTVDLASTANVTGVLPVANGGTNSSTALSSNRFITSSGGKIVEAAVIAASKVIVSDANGLPVAATTTTTQVNYLSAATGTTGTTSTNLVFSASPTFTGTVTAALISASDNFTITGTAKGIFLHQTAASATQSNTALTAYEEATSSGTWTANNSGNTVASGNIKINRVGNTVTITFPGVTLTANASDDRMSLTTFLSGSLAWAAPAVQITLPTLPVRTSGAVQTTPGMMQINTSGTIVLFRDNNGTVWGTGANTGFSANASITYNLG